MKRSSRKGLQRMSNTLIQKVQEQEENVIRVKQKEGEMEIKKKQELDGQSVRIK